MSKALWSAIIEAWIIEDKVNCDNILSVLTQLWMVVNQPPADR